MGGWRVLNALLRSVKLILSNVGFLMIFDEAHDVITLIYSQLFIKHLLYDRHPARHWIWSIILEDNLVV